MVQVLIDFSPNLACATSLVPRPAPKPELGTRGSPPRLWISLVFHEIMLPKLDQRPAQSRPHCQRKFAPKGQRSSTRRSRGHPTAEPTIRAHCSFGCFEIRGIYMGKAWRC